MNKKNHTDLKAGVSSTFTDPRAFGPTKPVYSVSETLNLLPLGRSSFYAAIKAKRLRVANAA